MPVEKTLTFYAPLLRTASGVEAILSDTSVDRDNEVIGKAFLERAVKNGSLPALMDHENKALNRIGDWVNLEIRKRVVDGEEHFALAGEPKFFVSNPTAKILKDMVEKDGAEMAISITAIPHEVDEVTIKGVSHKRFVDGEMLSADFVGIPSNRYAAAVAIAKSFAPKSEKQTEVNNVTELSVEDLRKTLKEDREDLLKEFTAEKETLKALQDSVSELQKNFEDLKKQVEEEKKEPPAEEGGDKAEGEAEKQKEAGLKKKVEDREEKLESLRKTPEANTGEEAPPEYEGVNTILRAYKPVKA